jgi:DNA-binding Lrp family transcriptional regulator
MSLRQAVSEIRVLSMFNITQGRQVISLKDIELRLIAELMENSRRSDRELAKALGISQPTVTRTRTRLEKTGIIKEYTMIPDFNKLGYHLCSITLARFQEPPHVEAFRKVIEAGLDRLSEIPQAVLIERGMGHSSNGVVIALHKDYSNFSDFQKWLKQFSILVPFELENFLINLDDEIHYRYLTFSTLAKHLLTMQKQEKE